jgi:hypothetical protein
MKDLTELVAQLHACPTRDQRITEARFRETWNRLRTVSPEHGEPITTALMVGVLLFDPQMFAPLLTTAQHTQLQTLGQAALGRYLQLTQPPNPLGKTIAAALLEEL